MFAGILIFLLVSKTTVAQINGEFWWLNDKVAKLQGEIKPPPPKFEELSEFDTDESAKIIFRDDNFISTGGQIEETKTINKENVIKQKENKSLETWNIVWPDDSLIKPIIARPNKGNASHHSSLVSPETTTTKVGSHKQSLGDIFIFRFPEDNNIIIEYPPKAEKPNESSHQNINDAIIMPKDDQIKLDKEINKVNEDKRTDNSDLFTFKFPDESQSKYTLNTPKDEEIHQSNEKNNVVIDNSNEMINSQDDPTFTYTKESSLAENICSFMKKNECYQKNGIVYTSENKNSKPMFNTDQVCCVLPLPNSYRIVFPDSLESSQEVKATRFRRSSKEPANTSLKQRDFLLRQKFRPQNVKPTSQTKVVTIDDDDDDYIDPYLNVKGSTNSKKPSTHSSSKQDYSYPDYVEDYVVELPKPGLVGLYSDNNSGSRQPWPFFDDHDTRPSYGASVGDSEEDDEPSFGYSTVDPRRGTTKTTKRGRPLKLTTSPPEDVTYNIESQTVSFQSSPNFQVLQGFKLLNLGRNKNKFYSKNTRRSTTEGILEESEEMTSHSDFFEGNVEQVFENCGKTKKLNENDANDKQFGEAESGSHPWMALVVLTRQPQGILCYATVVHPRAAVTAGACVYGRTSPKEVALIAGLWTLSDRSRAQSRVVTAQLHPQYRPKVLAHDLALLHWKTPLKLNANVQPACLGSVRDAADCKIYGWGGFDQGIRPKSRWQRASVLAAQECVSQVKAVAVPDDGFCATVQSRGTVTGIGGSLTCDVGGRKAAAGVAVWRDHALVLVPAHEWIVRAFRDLNIE